MCGITGIIGNYQKETIERMNHALLHRGPDEDGFYLGNNIALGNRRLSIIDLSTGKQPIYNEDNSIVVVYNGEIYNFQSIREDLQQKGHKFRTKTDTEIIVHAYEEYGINCLKLFNGNFVFALYDTVKDLTFIARDRLGIRPLYYHKGNDCFMFASELKALLVSGMINKELNYKSIDKYLTLRYSWGTETFFNNIFKLPAASYLIYQQGHFTINKYWDIDYTEIKHNSYQDYIDNFEHLFERSVQLRMISDVPFGAFLSGGLDSSFIVAMMAKHSNRPVETYSLGFNLDIDETSEARKTAEYFGCNHHEINISKQSYDLLPEVVSAFDEPLGDSIIIPTYLLAKEASKNLKVVLTGEGADEIFGGYIHQMVMHYGSIYNNIMPDFIKNKVITPSVKYAPMHILDKMFPYPSDLGKKGKQKLLTYLENIKSISDSYFSIASILSPADKEAFYTTNFMNIIRNIDVREDYTTHLISNSKLPALNQLIDLDIKYWLADYTLFKQDRLTMANSIEGRIPYLDHNLVEYVSKIPLKYKINGMNTKYLLRKVAKKYLPRPTAFRAKKAFYFPYQQCFKDDFNNYLKDLFNNNALLISMEIINKNQLDKLCENSLNNELLSSKQLMSMIILEHWLRIFYK